MNRAKLIDTLRQQTGISKRDADSVVRMFFDEMSNALAKGDQRLQATNWRLIARARWALNDSEGARRAERKASDLGG